MKISIAILFLITTFSCTKNKEIESDKGQEISIDNSHTDNLEYEFQVANSSKDTLKLISNSNYFYSCFGQYTNPNELESGLGEDFKLVQEKTYVYNDTTNADTLFRVTHINSYLKFIHDQEENKMHIVSGKISDPGFTMTNGLKVGLSKNQTNDILFKDNQPPNIDKFNNILVETALTGMWINFSFSENKLKEVSIDTDYQVNNK